MSESFGRYVLEPVTGSVARRTEGSAGAAGSPRSGGGRPGALGAPGRLPPRHRQGSPPLIQEIVMLLIRDYVVTIAVGWCLLTLLVFITR